MPDSSGQYLGDQATVLPDNTNAMLHFSNLFAQKEQQRRAQKLAQERADQQRRIGLQKYLGDKLTSKDFHTNSTYQGIVNSGLENISATAQKLLNELPEDQVYAYLNEALPAVRAKANKANELDANIASQAADFKAQHPDVDLPALISAARADASYKQDKDGNPVLKDLSSEVDPAYPWLKAAFDKAPENFYNADAAPKAWNSILSKDKGKDVNEIPAYDEKQNLKNIPFKGKVPSFAAVVKDQNGNVIWDENTGNPKVDIPGSHNYRIDGAEYVDDQGKKVRVVGDETFSKFYNGAIKADIEKQVKKVLSNGDLSTDSDYADMLRKKLLYDKLVNEATNASSFTTLEGKSFERKNTLLGRELQKAQMQISKHNSERADQKFAWDKTKAGIDANGPKPLTDKYENEAGKTILNPLTGQMMKFVETNKIDKGELQTITGNKASSISGESPDNTQPFDLGDGKKVFLIDDNGDWFGKDKDGNLKEIDRDAAYRRQINAGKKGTAEIVAPPKQNKVQKLINTVKKAVTPAKKPIADNPLNLDL
jgi:hypothetical protein